MSQFLVIIPTYNEIENIELMVNAVMGLEKKIDLLVVDDNSPDGTAQKVEELMQTFNHDDHARLHLLKRTEKTGLGTAYIAGFNWALERPYQFICEMDCDFSHPVNKLPTLFSICENGADVCVGSRYCNGLINVINWPMGRLMISYYASKYVKFITGLKIADSTAGFVCYRRIVLETIGINKIRFRGYAFQIEMKYRSFCNGFNIVEHPIIFTDRIAGNSKMSTKIFREAFFGVIELKIKRLLGQI